MKSVSTEHPPSHVYICLKCFNKYRILLLLTQILTINAPEWQQIHWTWPTLTSLSSSATRAKCLYSKESAVSHQLKIKTRIIIVSDCVV